MHSLSWSNFHVPLRMEDIELDLRCQSFLKKLVWLTWFDQIATETYGRPLNSWPSLRGAWAGECQGSTTLSGRRKGGGLVMVSEGTSQAPPYLGRLPPGARRHQRRWGAAGFLTPRGSKYWWPFKNKLSLGSLYSGTTWTFAMLGTLVSPWMRRIPIPKFFLFWSVWASLLF